MNRRDFLFTVAVLPSGITLIGQDRPAKRIPAVVSTWEIGKRANAKAWEILEKGGRALDAVEKGCNDAELDPNNHSVGYGGLPNEEGEVTLDALIMDGKAHRAGSVACLKRIKTPNSVARKVMEKTNHTLLVGEDATRFAKKFGFEEADLLTDESRAIWEKWKANPERKDFWNHDTIGMVAIDAAGGLAAGCTTSGLAFKIAGRVGDSPIIGAGAYVDNDVGAAAATGNGDIMMRFCLTHTAVEFMRLGLSPMRACEAALKRITDKKIEADACLIALDRHGDFGGAKIGSRPFPFAARSEAVDEIQTVK
jgi:isoaspartyl peptidase/L-asparaginase-like protein (Ntn-hydrolase superfamily)